MLVHEYTHSLQVANGPWLNHSLDEGFATYITGQITKRDEIINFDFDADFNYSYYPTEITRENAEQLFLEEPEDGWDNYLYGYRFMMNDPPKMVHRSTLDLDFTEEEYAEVSKGTFVIGISLKRGYVMLVRIRREIN